MKKLNRSLAYVIMFTVLLSSHAFAKLNSDSIRPWILNEEGADGSKVALTSRLETKVDGVGFTNSFSIRYNWRVEMANGDCPNEAELQFYKLQITDTDGQTRTLNDSQMEEIIIAGHLLTEDELPNATLKTGSFELDFADFYDGPKNFQVALALVAFVLQQDGSCQLEWIPFNLDSFLTSDWIDPFKPGELSLYTEYDGPSGNIIWYFHFRDNTYVDQTYGIYCEVYYTHGKFKRTLGSGEETISASHPVQYFHSEPTVGLNSNDVNRVEYSECTVTDQAGNMESITTEVDLQ